MADIGGRRLVGTGGGAKAMHRRWYWMPIEELHATGKLETPDLLAYTLSLLRLVAELESEEPARLGVF